MPIDYDDYEKINKLFFSIFENDEIMDYYYNVVSSCLFGNKEESFYIFTGEGSNGKGLQNNLLEKAMGKYYLMANNDLLTRDDEHRNDTLYEAQHVRILGISEPSKKANSKKDDENKFNITTIKKLTGNDTINARKTMSAKTAKYRPPFSIIAQMNRILETDETGNAAQRRFKFIHFPFNFVENPTKPHERPLNKDLKNIIETDEILYKSFMNLLLKRAFENKNKKIIIPKVYEDFKEDYFKNNDVITLYINRRLEKTGNEKDYIKVSVMFEDFKQDKEKQEFMTNKKFTALLKEKLKFSSLDGCNIIRGYKFVKIENKNEDEEGFINDDSDDDCGFMPK